jgi:hypothetical protein
MEEKGEQGILTSQTTITGLENLRNAVKKATEKTIGKSKQFNKGEPLSAFNLTYDSSTNHLESVYFWLLDFLKDNFAEDVRKITDNFTSSPGSGHFAEMGIRATRMQEQGMKILGMVNQVVKTILNLIYDLKEFEIRLEHYEDAKSEDKKKKEAGILSLKQIWLDNVDMKRGRGSIHQMSYEMGFTTLREVFMISNSLEDIKNNKIVNEQVKRILIPRLSEFLKWKEYSEKELRKRFEIEKSYLRTEVESLKLYTSWVRPYLRAAEQLRQKGFEKNPSLVNAFNTTMFELVLFGRKQNTTPPKPLKDYKYKRKYYSCNIISFVFRGFPQKVTQQHYGFGGRVDMVFDCYALNEDELKLVEKELEKQDIEQGLSFIQKATDKSLEELKQDIEHFLNDKPATEEKNQKENKEDINPFSALFGFFKKQEKPEEKKSPEEQKKIRKDNFAEKELRAATVKIAKDNNYRLYDIYKKAHGMMSSLEEFKY